MDQDTQKFFKTKQRSGHTFSIDSCTKEQIKKIITSIKTNANGHDDITISMILLALDDTLPIITDIINASIQFGVFPEAWKIAKVRPIPKSSKVDNYKELRPVSILPLLSKVLEKVVCGQLTNYLEANKLLPDTQSGFCSKHGTATALAKVTDDIITSSDKGQATILVLLDFSRAFDCLNPDLLVTKMASYGVSERSCSWFQSYLTDRTQYVELQLDSGELIHSKSKEWNEVRLKDQF
jgi:hypothetical protein